MRSDAYVNVSCDECYCEDVWEPEYVYMDYSGNNGHYDTTDDAFSRWCEKNNWTEIDDRTVCEDCVKGN